MPDLGYARAFMEMGKKALVVLGLDRRQVVCHPTRGCGWALTCLKVQAVSGE